jgi:hypothetical protein
VISPFLPAPVLPSQFYRPRRRTGAERLMLAVLADALVCVANRRVSDLRWLQNKQGNHLFSFVTICEVLGFHAESIRRAALVPTFHPVVSSLRAAEVPLGRTSKLDKRQARERDEKETRAILRRCLQGHPIVGLNRQVSRYEPQWDGTYIAYYKCRLCAYRGVARRGINNSKAIARIEAELAALEKEREKE